MEETIDGGVTEQGLMLEALRLMRSQPLRDDEVTVVACAEMLGLSQRRARYILDRYTEEGVLSKRMVQDNGHVKCAYSPAASGGWQEVIAILTK